MNFWTKDILQEVLPDAKFYNFPDNFSSNGIRVTYYDFDYGNMALIKKEDGKVGISETFMNNISDKVSALVCDDSEYFSKYNLPMIEVKNLADVPQLMAKFIRDNYKGQVIDITGSAGKSTTTRMCYDVLKKYGASANLTRSNTNFGIAWNMTLYNLENPYWLNETSLGGGMTLNSKMTKPHIAIITNIAAVHLTENQTLKDVALMKSNIFASMKKGDVAILYKEMAYFDIVEQRALKKNLKIITYGVSEDADIRILTGGVNSLNIFGKLYKFNDTPTQTHLLLDAAATLAVVYELCLDIEESINILNKFESIIGRGQVTSANIDENRFVTLVDESYNANPLSMKFALDGFNKFYGDKENKLLILGDMSEGGAETQKQHMYLFEDVVKINPSRVLLCGEKIDVLGDLLTGKCEVQRYKSVNDLLGDLFNHIKDDDYIFVKASNSMELYKVVIAIKNKIKEFNKI